MRPILASLQTHDFEEMRAALTGWDHQYRQIGSGPFSGSLQFSQLNGIQVFRNKWSRRIYYQGTSPEGTVGLAITLNQRDDARWMGITASRNDVIIQKSGAEADYLSPAEWDAFVIRIPQAEFDRTASKLLGVTADEVLEFHGTARLGPELCDRLRNECSTYLRAVQEGHSPRHLSYITRHLVSSVVGCLISAYPSRFEVPGLVQRRALIRRAEAYVDEAAIQPVLISDICGALGVSERTLFYAFSDTVGMTPVHWLRAHKLNKVRLALDRGDPSCTLVKQTALEHGFYHFGHFSRNYKNLFGERPSETLNRTSTSERARGLPFS